MRTSCSEIVDNLNDVVASQAPTDQARETIVGIIGLKSATGWHENAHGPPSPTRVGRWNWLRHPARCTPLLSPGVQRYFSAKRDCVSTLAVAEPHQLTARSLPPQTPSLWRRRSATASLSSRATCVAPAATSPRRGPGRSKERRYPSRAKTVSTRARRLPRARHSRNIGRLGQRAPISTRSKFPFASVWPAVIASSALRYLILAAHTECHARAHRARLGVWVLGLGYGPEQRPLYARNPRLTR